jgi:hypothetical protein
MPRPIRSLLLTLFLWCGASAVHADHYSGGSLTYECVGNNFYRINLDLLLDCSGTVLTAQNLNLTNDCGIIFTLNNIPQVLNEELSPYCQGTNSTCNGGVLPGLRRRRFQQTVFLSPCNKWTISWSVCCRNASENLVGGPGMYLETTLNNFDGVCDRSPRIADESNPIVCLNRAVQFNPGFNDPDGDRMGFELIAARNALPAPTPLPYDPGTSGTAPIPGIVLDPHTGQLAFTPTVTGNFIVVLQVTTYNALNEVIGTVMRDFIVTVVNCADVPPQPSPPVVGAGATLVGPHELIVCDGVPFCLTLSFSDTGPNEAIALLSNATALLPGATFTTSGMNPVTGTLCWTPDLAHARTNVHFKARDRACPRKNVASVSLLIRVDAIPAVPPNAGIDGTLARCPTDPPIALLAGLGGTPEPGGSWTFQGVPHGPLYDPTVDGPGVYTYTVVGASPCATATASVTVVEPAIGLVLEFQSGSTAPQLVTYEVLAESGPTPVLSGINPVPANSIGTTTLCLPDGCYRLRVTDGAGDGLLGYVLRETGVNGRRLIDNTSNMNDGVSQIAGDGTFCLPLGTDKPIHSSCDKLDWVNNKFIVCHANAAVSAEYGVTNATSGYEFWFYDPNGSYSFRRFRSHSTSDGYGSGATRACHFKVNGWINSMATPHIPANTLLNVRVRGRVAGSNLAFGPACQFRIDAALAACPRVSLQDDPANVEDYSCGVSREFGGASRPANRIYATPPQPIPLVPGNMVRYQFRFRIDGEGVCIVRPPQTGSRMVLSWATGVPLVCSKTYEVDVRVSLDGGATWCFGPGATDQASACADTEDWGKVCNVTINCPPMDGGGNSMALQGDGGFTMYPNPNRGDQLFVNMSSVQEGVQTVSVDIFDLTGKRVSARTIAVQDGSVRTNMDLNGDLSSGMYMVHVTVGDKTYTERLVIQP